MQSVTQSILKAIQFYTCFGNKKKTLHEILKYLVVTYAHVSHSIDLIDHIVTIGFLYLIQFDESCQKLFDWVRPSVLSQNEQFVKLLSSYDLNRASDYNECETNDQKTFIDAIMETKVMEICLSYLKKFKNNKVEFRKKLLHIWFDLRNGTCAFEHIFVGKVGCGYTCINRHKPATLLL